MNANDLANLIDSGIFPEGALQLTTKTLREIKSERDFLFEAHSNEMVRADKLVIENEALKLRVDELLETQDYLFKRHDEQQVQIQPMFTKHEQEEKLNTNELADALDEVDLIYGYENIARAQAMLREQQRTINGDKRLINLLYGKIDQQQEQIEALITEREQNAQNIDQISKSLPNGNEPVAWKSYEEVHFSDQYILRWVREGNEYVNRISKEMMEEFKFLIEKEFFNKENPVKEVFNNEPVAWIDKVTGKPKMIGYIFADYEIPLYLHPAKELNAGGEPVAWMLKTGHGTKILEKKPYCEVDYWIPLYTHPAKTLTDEEILKVYWDMQISIETHEGVFAFARAVLRKAQQP